MITLRARIRCFSGGLVRAGVVVMSMLLLPACGSGTSEAQTETETPSPVTASVPAESETPAPAPSAADGSLGAVAGAVGATPPPTAAPAGTPAGPPPATEPRQFEATSTGLSSGGARMTFDKTVHDFGTVWDVQSNLPAEFPFRNTGTAALEIVDMKPDCGCTVPGLEKRRYDPGERGVITVRYTPKGIGATEKFINLITNVGGQGVTRVSIRSDNRRFVWADPPNLQFQPARVGEPHRAVVTINCDDPAFEIDEVRTTQGSIHATGAADFLEARLIEGSSPPEVEIVLTDGAPWGNSFAMAHVSGTGTIPGGETKDFSVRIMVKADLVGELRADRTYYTLKLIPPGASFEQAVRIFRQSGEPFNVLGAEVRGGTMPGTKVDVRPITDGDAVGYDVVLSGETGSYVGSVKGSVVVETDVPGEEELEFRFSGLVRREASK